MLFNGYDDDVDDETDVEVKDKVDDNDNNTREHNMLEEKDYAPLEALTARICTD